MRRGRGGSGGGGIARWLLLASVLHAAVGLVALVLPRRAEPPMALVTHGQVVAPPEEIPELTLLVDAAWSAPLAARSSASASAPEPTRATPAARAAVSNTEAPVAPPLGSDGSSSPSPPASSAIVSEKPPEPEAAARLSLDRLGIGKNPFATDGWATLEAPAPTSEAERSNQRLQASLHQPWFESDRQRGLGPEGPIVDAARRLLVADDDLSETSAVLNIRVDGGGRVTDVHALEASSQSREWQMIAARLAKHLGPMTLRGPGSGWGVKLRLTSALKLPSGLAPGMQTDILGLTLPGSAGPGAASLSLTPTSPLPMPEPIDRVGRQVDRVMLVELGLLKLKADVADIGSSAQRVVQVAVLSLDEAAAP